jgi:energy-coupling factor transporter ATP-binding protein EcfA2
MNDNTDDFILVLCGRGPSGKSSLFHHLPGVLQRRCVMVPSINDTPKGHIRVVSMTPGKTPDIFAVVSYGELHLEIPRLSKPTPQVWREVAQQITAELAKGPVNER